MFPAFVCALAHNGRLAVSIPTARNDRAGRWTVRVRELSSGLAASAQVEVTRIRP